jgi:hypothetical protein
MHTVTFYPVGNADCCRIDLANSKALLFDFANYPNEGFDLAKAASAGLKDGTFDVVAFTHADDDHIHGASDFFYLEHAVKYQSETRIKIKELWVPAAFILEPNLSGDARVIQAEAKYRLKQGSGVRVFSRPQRLEDWLSRNNVTLADRRSLITEAGQLVPGWTGDGVEFFVHCPFAHRVDDQEIDRNEDSLILQATFLLGSERTRFFIIGDTAAVVLAEIVRITRARKNDERLEWDIYDVPHHCSYLALSDERGRGETKPLPDIEFLLGKASRKAILVSSSDPIPNSNANPQPPHPEAAKCYRRVAEGVDGQFVVTMEYPNSRNPKPVVLEIDETGVALRKRIEVGVNHVISRPAPRAGGLSAH